MNIYATEGHLPYLERHEGKMRPLHTVAIALTLFCCSLAHAEQRGTRDEAVAMVQAVQQMARKEGLEATFASITRQDAPFKKKDLYPFVYDFDGLSVAHGSNPKMVGKSWMTTKDQDGNYLIKRMSEVATSSDGRGWVSYKWPHPITHKIQDKAAYIERLGDRYFVGVGVYMERD